MPQSAAVRKKRQRESGREWLRVNAYGLTPDALVSAGVRGEVKLVWIKKPTPKTTKKK